MENFLQHLINNLRDHPGATSSDSTQYIAFGTAGFRGHAEKIKHLFYRVGIIAGVRCLVDDADVGVMVTASHNPVHDNGVKLIDSNGGMLAEHWEQIVEEFCNLRGDPESICNEIRKLIERFRLDLKDCSQRINKPKVHIGHDSRPSSISLVELVLSGLSSWSSLLNVIDHGLLTTPALHYLVAESNKQHRCVEITDYYNQLVDGISDYCENSKCKRKYYNPTRLVVDCANGVGYETMKFMCNTNKFFKHLPVKLINTGDGVLNENCGADFVKTKLCAPSGANELGTRYATLDGDADRIIYFYLENAQPDKHDFTLRLLDGDKIMALYALYLKDVLKRSGLDASLTLGIVQTAYANGASTDYLTQQLGLSVECADTGVKNLHQKALRYDFGIYFEANGHGTIWISENAKEAIRMLVGDAGVELKRLVKILNNYTGDAVSDILIVEMILDFYDMDIESWYKFYEDRANSLIKVEVRDRSVVRTTNAGRTCVEPAGLQAEIDAVICQFSQHARGFVRASGTEDVVRIYAEARTNEEADRLAHIIASKVVQFCN